MASSQGDLEAAAVANHVVEGGQEEKSEAIGDSLINDDPTFWDCEGLADVSVTAEESAVMADLSENRTKKKKDKKKKKKASKTKSRRQSRSHAETPSDLSADEETDAEATPRKWTKSKSKETKKKVRSKKDKDDGQSAVEGSPLSSESERKSKSKKGRKKSSSKDKKKKKRKKSSSKAAKDEGKLRQPEALASTEGPTNNMQEDTSVAVSEGADFPPDLDSDSSSSELPDPSDLDDMDDTSEYESDTSSSSIEPRFRQVSHVPSILGEPRIRFSPDAVEMDELSSKSVHSVNLPPQTIPGSLANEVVEYTNTSEQHPNLEAVKSTHNFALNRKDWKCWAIVVMSLLLVGAIVSIVVLTRRDDGGNGAPAESNHPVIFMKGTMDLSNYTLDDFPDLSALAAWNALTRSFMRTRLVEGDYRNNNIELDSLDVINIHRSTPVARSTDSQLVIEFLLMVSTTGDPPLNLVLLSVEDSMAKLEDDPVYLSALGATDASFQEIEQISTHVEVLPTNGQVVARCSEELKDADGDGNGKLNYAEFFDFLSSFGDCQDSADLQVSNIRQVLNDFETGGGDNGPWQEREINLAGIDRRTLRRLCVVSGELVADCDLPAPSPNNPVPAPSTGSTVVPSMIDPQPLADKLGIILPTTIVPQDPASVAAFVWLLNEDWPLESTPDYFLRDRYALAALYYATEGDQWQTNQFWLSSLGVCQWHGVLCDTFDAVQQLDLNENGLSNSLPTELGFITSLAEIDMGMNIMGFTIPSQIGLLTSLSRLDLMESNFSGTIPAELGGLTSLISLNLAGNVLTSTLPTELALLTQLEFFDISMNKLTGPLPAQVGSMTSLTFLNLSSNIFNRELPLELGFLNALRELHAEANEFWGSIPSEFGLLTQLTSLRLSANTIEGNIPTTLGNLSVLTDLALHDNSLTGDLDPIFCLGSASANTFGEFSADCNGQAPEVICSCCTTCY